LSSDASELAEVRAFREGCDHYVRKPVSYPVPPDRRLESDARERRVTVAERPVHVSGMEFELLWHLGAEPTRVYTKEELLRDVWGFKAPGNTRTVDAHACRLRKKLA
jgi:Transcriptional regulatory protein, C terminal